MTEIKESCYKGTRILLGNDKRVIINKMIDLLIKDGYQYLLFRCKKHLQIR